MSREPLTVGEFTRWAERFDGRFDKVDDGLRDHGERIAVLEAAPAKSKRRERGWSAGVAAVIIGAMEILHRLGIIK